MIEILRNQAKEIADAGINGWGNTMIEAADTIESMRQQLASRDAEIAWVRDVLAAQGYDGPLAPGCCPLEDWLKERDQLREQVKMLRDAIEYSGAAKSCQGLADALAATEPKE
jgi:hypothetical protein